MARRRARSANWIDAAPIRRVSSAIASESTATVQRIACCVARSTALDLFGASTCSACWRRR
eukprot:782054-Pyramimonas_sp.AAC.1